MSTSLKNEIQKHLDNLPDDCAEEVLQYLRFLEFKMREPQADNSSSLLSEASLAKEWLTPEEDTAWQYL